MEGARPARPDELPRCAELLAQARQEAGPWRGAELLASTGADASHPEGRAEAPSAAVSRWASGAGRALLLVGLFDDVVVGLAAGTARSSIGLIECCYVEPAARQVGVGAALVSTLVDWFARCCCTGIDAWALPGDRQTKQLLETAGFSARLLVLHRPTP